MGLWSVLYLVPNQAHARRLRALAKQKEWFRADDPDGLGPSRWLLVVVRFEQQPGRIVTALATRKDPKRWNP